MKVYNFLMRLNELVMYYGMKVVNAYVDYIRQYAIVSKFGIVILVDAIIMEILQV